MPGREADVAENGAIENSRSTVRGSLQGPFLVLAETVLERHAGELGLVRIGSCR